jgi:branched-chain amino acid transport system substrate-binding protein
LSARASFRVAVTLCAAVLAAGGLAACARGDDGPRDGAQDGPLLIGLASAQTGFMSTYDNAVRDGAKVAADEINSKGGVNGRQIEFVEADSKSDPAQAQLAAQTLLSAEMIIPSCDYNMGGPAAQAANARNVLAVGCAGSSLFGAQGIGPLTFNVLWGAATEGAVMAEWAYQTKAFRNPHVIVATNFEYSKSVCENFEKRWTELAGADSIAGKDTYEYEDKALASQVSRLQEARAKADFVVVCATGAGASMVRQARSAGVDLPMIGAAGFDGDYWLEAVPDLSEFYYPAAGSLFGDDPSADRKTFFEAYASVAGEHAPLSLYPLAGYQAVQTYARGIEKAASFEAAKVQEAIESFRNEELIIGPTTYAENCHVAVGQPLLMMQIQQGKISYTGETFRATQVPAAPC